MRAAVLRATGEPLAIEEVRPLEIGAHEVVVRVDASGVCHSDLSAQNGTLPFPPPMVLGHEATGIVESVGSDVTRVAVGDRVISSIVAPCGHCYVCVHGQPFLCRTFHPLPVRNVGVDGAPIASMVGLGSFAECMTVLEHALVPVRTDLPPEQLALVGCGVMTGVGAVLNTAGVVAGATVAVVGCGGVGQAIVQGAVIAGAAEVYAIDPVGLKRETSLRLGATHAIDPDDADPVEAVRDLTGGLGADYAFEAVGNPATIGTARQLVRAGGLCVVVGLPRRTEVLELPAGDLMQSTLVGSPYGSAHPARDFPRLVRLAESGRLDLASMVSERIRLDDVNTAFDAMRAGSTVRSVITSF
jgi:S-(hydroxymethyl)glutathione dehydrogenase/alcohol dehydrogenase